MAKKIKIWQAAVLTKDEEGNVSLVGKAKEALTTMHKKDINITVCLLDIAKVDAEKCLKDNNVPFDELKEAPANNPVEDYDCMVVAGPNVVTLHHDWQYCMDEVARRLYGEKPKQNVPTEQQEMDNSFDNYIKWAKEASKQRISR